MRHWADNLNLRRKVLSYEKKKKKWKCNNEKTHQTAFFKNIEKEQKK